MSDSYSTDPAKAKARETIEENARRALPKDRKQATAVYLAGTNSKESELLDRLGITRENRIILEHRQDRLWKTRHANSGVRVLHISTDDFLERGYKDYPHYFPLWYCGLDYECKLNKQVTRDLANIARHELIIDGGILYTNVVGQREQEDAKEAYAENLFERAHNSYLFRNHFSESFKQALGIVSNGSTNGELQKEAIKKMLETLPGEKLTLLRNLAVVSNIQESLLITPGNCRFLDVYCPGSARLIRWISSSQKYACASAPQFITNLEETKMTFDSLPISLLFANMKSNSKIVQTNESLDACARSIERHAVKYYNRGDLEILTTLFHVADSKGYVPNRMVSHSYISNTNTLMMLDILQVKKCKSAVKQVMQQITERDLRIIYGTDYPYLASENVRFGDLTDTLKTLVWNLRRESTRNIHWLENLAPYLEHLNPYTVGKQHYTRKSLASSYRPALRRKQAHQCAIEGWSDEKIEEKFIVSKRGWRSLAAFRANVTTGKITTP